jgi:hypothetical protein
MKLKEVIRKIIPKHKYVWFIAELSNGSVQILGGFDEKREDRMDRQYPQRGYWKDRAMLHFNDDIRDNVREVELFARKPLDAEIEMGWKPPKGSSYYHERLEVVK